MTAEPDRAPAAIRSAIDDLRGATVEEVGSVGGRHLLYAPGDLGVATHLDQDITRLEEMMRLFYAVGQRRRVLDLGANPYILSYAMLRSGSEVVAGGHPVHGERRGDELVLITAPGSGSHTLPLVRFNVESDVFPFEDSSFDVVVCGELIEHLIAGPDRLLEQCARVLTPGGTLILTTPNAVSLSRLVDLAKGRNLDWPFSTQGVYARHNRLYTSGELRDLLTGSGFQVVAEHGWTMVHPRRYYARGVAGTAKWIVMNRLQRLSMRGSLTRRWADDLVICAQLTSTPSRYRPSWLFGGSDTVPMVAK